MSTHRQRLPPLKMLLHFDAVARRGSFARAAEELSVTPSAVSHSILSLEDWFGRALFLRSSHGVCLTDEGQCLAPFVDRALMELAAGVQAVQAAGGPATCRLSAPPTLGRRWLGRVLQDFRARFPDIQISISLAHQVADLREGDADIAVRMFPHAPEDPAARCLFRERLAPVASPALATAIRSGARLEDQIRLEVSTSPGDWSEWYSLVQRAEPEPPARMIFDTLELAWQAAAQGLGVALGRWPLLDEESRSGELLALEAPIPSPRGYWLLSRPDATPDSPVAQVARWLHDQVVELAQAGPPPPR